MPCATMWENADQNALAQRPPSPSRGVLMAEGEAFRSTRFLHFEHLRHDTHEFKTGIYSIYKRRTVA